MVRVRLDTRRASGCGLTLYGFLARFTVLVGAIFAYVKQD